jgi:type II secretory pathway component PulK
VLLAVLCLVVMLSFLVITTVGMSKQHADMQIARMGMTRARQLAEEGIAVAVHPVLRAGDPLLRRQVSDIESYEAQLTTEERRLNLNALLTPDHLPMLERIFQSWGMSLSDAQDIAASMMDWVDPDDLKRRPGSAEKLDYEFAGRTGLPLNRPFSSLDEVELVARMNEVRALKPDWRNWFTLRGSGQLDINTAPAEIIAAVTGASLENAMMLVKTRNGLDGVAFTQDDAPFKSIEAAVSMLGMMGPGSAGALPLLTLQGPTRHIECVGTAGDARCGIGLVLTVASGRPRIAEWSEFAVKGPGQP